MAHHVLFRCRVSLNKNIQKVAMSKGGWLLRGEVAAAAVVDIAAVIDHDNVPQRKNRLSLRHCLVAHDINVNVPKM